MYDGQSRDYYEFPAQKDLIFSNCLSILTSLPIAVTFWVSTLLCIYIMDKKRQVKGRVWTWRAEYRNAYACFENNALCVNIKLNFLKTISCFQLYNQHRQNNIKLSLLKTLCSQLYNCPYQKQYFKESFENNTTLVFIKRFL